MKKSEKIDRHLDRVRNLKKAKLSEDFGNPNNSLLTNNSPRGIGKETDRNENQKNRDHNDHSIVKIVKNTHKSPRHIIAIIFGTNFR